MNKMLRKQTAVWLALLLAVTSVSFGSPIRKANAEASSLVFDFEDGTTQGWYARGDTIEVTQEAQHSGANALRSSGRTANWNGPGYNLDSVLAPDQIYQVEAYVRLADGAGSTTANMTVQRTTDGTTHYDSVAYQTPVTADAWTKLSGTYTYTGGASSLSLYFELPESLGSFYVDDITINGVQAEPPADAPEKFTSDFEDGTVQGWTGRGGVEVLAPSANAAHEGAYGLQITGRTQGWNGPQHDITPLMVTGKTYTLKAWLRLPEGTPDAEVSMTIQRTANGEDHYEGVTSGTVKAGGWVKLEGEYKLSYPAEKAAVYFESSANATLPFYLDDFEISRNPDQPPITIQEDIPSLKDVLANDFRIGTAFVGSEIADLNGPDAALIKKHFNSVTLGNELKWDATEPQEGQFNFTRSDAGVAFAVDNGIAVRGHTLVWHSQVPDWVFRDDQNQLVSKEVLLQRLKNHIDTVVGRYKGKMYAWDVVNEVIDPSQPNGMRNSLWYQIAGEEYIEKAFIYAHAADPEAKLFINDYNTDQPLKRQFLHDLIKRLKDKGIPVDGVGHQMHINIQSPSAQSVDDMITAFSDLGIEQHITEMDMSSYTNDTDSWDSFPLDLQIRQAYRYKEMFDIFKKHKDQVTSVTLWGKDDANSWLRTFPITRKNWPLLFDERLQAKPAYWGIVDPSKVPVEIHKTSAAAGTAVIDGITESAWDRAPSTSIYHDGVLAATFKTLWDPKHLFVTVEVKDPKSQGNDAVEVFLDGNNGKTAAYEADDKSVELRRSGANPHKEAPYKVKRTDDGFCYEASIPISGGELGKEIGFDIRLRDKTGNTFSYTSWNDTTNSQDTDTSKFGTLTLTEGMRITEAVKGTPTIDGIVDGAWDQANEIITDRWVAGTSGSQAKVRTMWDNGHLYVLAQVTDSFLTKRSANVWEQDSFEIFIDQNNHKSSTFESDDGQYRVNFQNEASYNPASLEGTMVSAVKQTPDGYVVEAAIDLSSIIPKADTIIGFDAQVNNDENDDGIRDSVAIWNDTTGQSYQSTASYGLVKLLP